jgi:hypothetical protein
MGDIEATRPTCPCETRRGRFRWNTGTLTALAVAIVVALSVGRDRGTAVAQQGGAGGPRAHVYRQTQVLWTGMDRTLTEWESKGWETYQIVPIANPNPGSGAAMQVAIVFRRPAGGGN